MFDRLNSEPPEDGLDVLPPCEALLGRVVGGDDDPFRPDRQRAPLGLGDERVMVRPDLELRQFGPGVGVKVLAQDDLVLGVDDAVAVPPLAVELPVAVGIGEVDPATLTGPRGPVDPEVVELVDAVELCAEV